MASLEDRYMVAVLVGSLRAESLTRKLVKALMALAPSDLACTIVEIGDLPLYNEDLEADAPQSWKLFREISERLMASYSPRRSITDRLQPASKTHSTSAHGLMGTTFSMAEWAR